MRLVFILGLAAGLVLPALAQKSGQAVDPLDLPLESLFSLEVTTASNVRCTVELY